MKAILGEKLEMTQMFDKEGKVIPVTLVRAHPNTVVQIRSKEKEGYAAVQVGAGERKAKNIKKPQKGHFRGFGSFRFLKEFRIQDEKFSMPVTGEKIDVSVFQEGDMVQVSGTSKSKGFQGVVKRHGFHGAPASHGTKHAHREPGSIGGGGRAGGRVARGVRMAGRMGGERVTVRNLTVAKVDQENNLIALKGAIPGRRGTLIEIRG